MIKNVLTVSSVLFLLGSLPAFAISEEYISQEASQQENRCTGIVKELTGEVAIGASVSVKGHQKGVITDLEGRFTLPNVAKGSTIRITFIGYEPQDVVWNGTPLTITLKDDHHSLDELVVVGYGTQKKVNLTGSVASISSKDIADIPVANTSSLLQGRMPGLVLTQSGAQAGNDNPEIRIRGVGTFGNNNPMVLIDGVEGSLSQISDIPSADIESVSVLKDAASAAIYGVRAANGVILITTKKGKEGRVKVTYSGSYTLQTPGIIPDFIDSYNWALMRNEANPDTYDATALAKLKNGSDPDHYANTNWLDAVLRNANMHQHNLSVSGGNKDTHFMTSVSYSNQDGIMIKTGIERISFRSNIDTRYKRFTFGVNLSGNKNNVTNPSVDASGSSSVMRYISWFTRPTVPVKYSDGHYGAVDGSFTSVLVKNPVEVLNRGYRLNEAWRFDGKVFAGLDIIEGLKFQTSFAYNFYLNATKRYDPKTEAQYDAEGNIVYEAGANNTLQDYYWREGRWTNENLLTYHKKFDEHDVNVMLGHSVIGYRYYTTAASKQGFPTENIYELSGGSKNPAASGSSGEYRMQSFFGRLNYSYADRYLFEFNLRHDGSSRMPKSHRYATFPSVSVGWVFSNEAFMKQWQHSVFGKLRLSWGKLGNQEIGNYAYTMMLAAQGNYYFDQGADPQIGMRQTSVPNENIKWETTRTVNVGIDLSFLNNRVSTTFDWYDKKTSDILMQLNMPSIFLGSLSAPYQNVGEVRNRGWEWTVNYQDHKGKWSWNASFNLSHVKNKILKMGNLTERIGGNTINRVGEPIGAYYGYEAIGLYRTEADLNRTNSKGEIIKQNGAVPQLGDIMYADLNDDGDITAEDRTIIGNPFPSYSYGFTLGASWNNFDITTFWQGVAGIYRYNWETTSDIRGNFTSRWLDRYSADNPDAKMPHLGNTFNDSYSSFWLEKSNYLRLKNLEVGYTFRQPVLSIIGVSQIRVYFAATNLLTFTPLKDWDPEKSSGDTRNDVHPNMRTYSFGVNVQF